MGEHQRQTPQDIAEVREGIDSVAVATGDQAEVDRRGTAAPIAAAKQPIAASQGNAPQGAFGLVIVDVEEPGLGVPAQRRPIRERRSRSPAASVPWEEVCRLPS